MNSTTADLHVIFGTGPVGMAIMEALHGQGKRIRMVNRSGNVNLPQGVELMRGDAANHDFSRKASEGAAVVYFALNPSYDKWVQLFPALQAGVLEGAASAGAKLVVMDNLYMYGRTGGKPMTEDTPFNPHTPNGKVRAQMAREIMAAHQSSKVRVAVGRAADFVGAGVESAMGDRVFYPALAGKMAQVLGNPDMPHTYSYTPDVGKALAVLGERDEALGQVWHIPSAETVTTRRFIEMIYEQIGTPARVGTAPTFIIQALGLFNPVMKAVAAAVYQFEQPFIVDHSKYERTFGSHATPLKEVIRTTLDWYRQHPQTH